MYIFIYSSVYTHLGCFHVLASVNSIANNAICSNKHGPGDDHSKWSEAEKDKYYMVSLICGIQKKKMIQVNAYKKQKWAQRHKKQTYSYHKGKGEEG